MAAIRITSGGKDYLARSAETIAMIFKDDPLIRYFTSSLSKEAHYAYMAPYIYRILKAATLNNAIFQEANDWSCCAVWLLPGARIDGFLTIIRAGIIQCLFKLGIGGVKRMLLDYEGQADKSKHKHLHGSKNFSYLLFIGTQVQNRGEGLAKELIRQQQAKASEQDLPIWLEATTILSRDVYLRCGFQAMDEICLRKGTHNENGNREPNGTGVTIWSMVWYPTPK